MSFSYLKTSYLCGMALLLVSVLGVFFSLKLFMSEMVIFVEWDIVSWGSVHILMTLLFDWMSVSFMGVVLLISSMVMFYSDHYMAGDININRFIILVFLFVLSMVFLVLSPNMISILLGWDGLGLVSYCLVIYYQNVKSANAGMLTVLSNRVGDVAILLCISWMFNFGGWNFYYMPFVFNGQEISIVLGLVILASMTSSAQIPFSAWLPAAMAAPTPVSALVHSSTLVTAGVYLLIRFNELLGTSIFLLYVSVLTMALSGVGANYEMDLKKIIALSTLSQLGVMLMTLSLGLVELTFFHLISHALFKSLLFLCAGTYIHSYSDAQDIRFLGGVTSMFPLTSLFFIGCSLSLCGFPFLSGFYSKDMILECYFMGEMNLFMFTLIILSTMATITYSIRLVYYMSLSNLGVGKVFFGGESWLMLAPMGVLFMMSTLCGASFCWVFISPLTVLLPIVFSGLVLCLGILFGLLMLVGCKEGLKFNYMKNLSLVSFFGGMWGLPTISTVFFINPLSAGAKLLKHLDHGWLEELGGQGVLNKMSLGSSFSLDGWNLLGVKSYLLMFFILLLFVGLSL